MWKRIRKYFVILLFCPSDFLTFSHASTGFHPRQLFSALTGTVKVTRSFVYFRRVQYPVLYFAIVELGNSYVKPSENDNVRINVTLRRVRVTIVAVADSGSGT